VEERRKIARLQKSQVAMPLYCSHENFTIEMGFMGRYIGRITTSDQERVRAAVGKIILPQSSIID